MNTSLPQVEGSRMVTGLFRDRAGVERARRSMIVRGYDQSEISIVMADDTRKRFFPGERMQCATFGDKGAKAIDLGGPVGGSVGILVAALSAVGGFLLLPGLGVVVAGPVAAAVAGAGIAGIAGGLLGILHDWGIPKDRIKEYETGIQEGGILIGVKPRSEGDARYIEQQWALSGGEQVHS